MLEQHLERGRVVAGRQLQAHQVGRRVDWNFVGVEQIVANLPRPHSIHRAREHPVDAIDAKHVHHVRGRTHVAVGAPKPTAGAREARGRAPCEADVARAQAAGVQIDRRECRNARDWHCYIGPSIGAVASR